MDGAVGGQIAAVDGWAWIDYRGFIHRVRQKLGAFLVNSGVTKWGIFLRELILNIENQMGANMGDEEFEFVKQHYSSFLGSINLHDQYIGRLITWATDIATKVLGVPPASVRRHSWGNWGIALRVFPLQDGRRNSTLLVMPDSRFKVQFYVEADALRPGVQRTDFAPHGFQDRGDEARGALWVFAGEYDNLSNGLTALRQSLVMLHEKLN